jgi:hypothetical protein
MRRLTRFEMHESVHCSAQRIDDPEERRSAHFGVELEWGTPVREMPYELGRASQAASIERGMQRYAEAVVRPTVTDARVHGK